MYITKPFIWKGVTSCMVLDAKNMQKIVNSVDHPRPSFIRSHVRYVLRVGRQKQTKDGPVYQCEIESFPSQEMTWSGDIAAGSIHSAMYKVFNKLTELLTRLVWEMSDDLYKSLDIDPSVNSDGKLFSVCMDKADIPASVLETLQVTKKPVATGQSGDLSVSKLGGELEADLNDAENRLMETGRFFTLPKEAL